MQGEIRNELGDLVARFAAARPIPPRRPIAHSDDRQRGAPRVDRAKIAGFYAALDNGREICQHAAAVFGRGSASLWRKPLFVAFDNPKLFPIVDDEAHVSVYDRAQRL